MPFMLPLEPLLKAEQDCSDSNPNLPPPPRTRTQAGTHPRVRTRTHAHTHKCTRTHVRARARMLEPTPFHTPLLTPGSPDPPALPTAPRRRHHGLGVPSAPSSAAPFPAHDGQRWGCTGQASSPRSPPGGGLLPGRGGRGTAPSQATLAGALALRGPCLSTSLRPGRGSALRSLGRCPVPGTGQAQTALLGFSLGTSAEARGGRGVCVGLSQSKVS